MQPNFDRVTRDPKVMNGQPCIRGMRLTISRVLEALATFPDRDQLFAEFPELEDDDLRQAQAFAAACLESQHSEIETLRSQIAMHCDHPTISAGIRGESIISSLLNGVRTTHNAQRIARCDPVNERHAFGGEIRSPKQPSSR